MGEIKIVGPGKTRGYPYPVCKKLAVLPIFVVRFFSYPFLQWVVVRYDYGLSIFANVWLKLIQVTSFQRHFAE